MRMSMNKLIRALVIPAALALGAPAAGTAAMAAMPGMGAPDHRALGAAQDPSVTEVRDNRRHDRRAKRYQRRSDHWRKRHYRGHYRGYRNHWRPYRYNYGPRCYWSRYWHRYVCR